MPEIKRMRVLVTGGSGFIGRATCRILIRDGADVLNFDTRSWPGPDAGPKTIVGDIEDTEALQRAFQTHDPAVVIHLAAFASVTAKARQDFSSIWNGTQTVANAFEKVTAPVRLINVSTQLVIKPGPQPSDLRAYDPYTAYGEAKAEAERYLDHFPRSYDVIHIRPTNIWGPHHPSYPKTVMRYLEKGWYLHPNTPQPVIRTYGYVDNCAAQIVSAAFSNLVHDGSILYSGDQAMDSKVYLDAMSQGLRGADVRLVPIAPLRAAAHFGSIVRSCGIPFPFDTGRFMRMSTNYEVPLSMTREVMAYASIPFSDAMTETVRWYRATLASAET